VFKAFKASKEQQVHKALLVLKAFKENKAP